jgi:hypothetical protein
VVFEAKQYKRPVEQGRLHALSNVVREIQDEQRPVTGVMVTTTGYQRGAKAVAGTYELLVLELCEPEEHDWHGRVRTIEITMHAQMPGITDLRIKASKSAEDAGTSKLVAIEHLMSREQDKAPRRLVDVLTAGELGRPAGHGRPTRYAVSSGRPRRCTTPGDGSSTSSSSRPWLGTSPRRP